MDVPQGRAPRHFADRLLPAPRTRKLLVPVDFRTFRQGPLTTLPRILEPLESVKNDILLLSNLTSNWGRPLLVGAGISDPRSLFERLFGSDIAEPPAAHARPTPVVLVTRAMGESLPFPGASIEKDFAWTSDHPVADAYRAYQAMPYDAPSWDMAAVLYAVHPELFELSDRTLKPTSQERILEAYVQIASAKPVVRQPGFRRPPADAKEKPPPPPVKTDKP
jgi:hypothetical protein